MTPKGHFEINWPLGHVTRFLINSNSNSSVVGIYYLKDLSREQTPTGSNVETNINGVNGHSKIISYNFEWLLNY